MEKSQLLGAFYKALSFLTLIVLLCSCAMPRIVVLRDPLTPEERINLGLAYEKNGEYEAALTEYSTAAKKLPIADFYIGNLYFQRGMIEKAEKAYLRAIARTDDPRAYNNLAWLYYVAGINPEKAEKLARTAVDLAPHNPDFQDTLARILEKGLTRSD